MLEFLERLVLLNLRKKKKKQTHLRVLAATSCFVEATHTGTIL
jgi:hypothetical protein